jgi:hypothetical protein
MQFVRATLLTAMLVFTASAADLNGTWKAVFLGDPGTWPKMVAFMTFDLKTDGNEVTGMAHMSSWPGNAPLSEGKFEGDRITFTAVGNSPWRSGGPQTSASGFPKLTFTGTVHGDTIDFDVVWDSVMIYGEHGHPRDYRMRATKLAK